MRFLTLALETAKELLGSLDEDIRSRGLERLARVDSSPADGDRVHIRPLRRLDVERRVADVRRLGGLGLQQLERAEDPVRVRLVALDFVARDDRVEEVRERQDAE